MGIPLLLRDEMLLRSVAFHIHFTNIWGMGVGTAIIVPVKPQFLCGHIGS